MQVSHVQDHVTHAVIGGKQAIDFGISNSAEFFNILSSTLYKDQILAVVREVLCNAWDAHIEAGCTDRPVQITLENDKFSIKDFGKGIHHDDMGLIYGTYGNSTKKNDGKQTGGFGLGCKAPFAYTDHFEVISCHAGTKTIYNLSKSSAQAQGKPGIIPIASFPTEETGLTVSIRIKGADYKRFQELIKRIVRNGDMNMTLNDQPLETIGFDANKSNYILILRQEVLDVSTTIMVRYGNVIYPVESTKDIASKYTAIANHMHTLRGHGVQYQMVLQAPPHSISVTPSRESLSMQEHTVNTLNKLFDGFLATLQNEFPAVCDKYAEDITVKAVTEGKIGELLKREEKLPELHDNEDIASISDLGSMARAYMRSNYPEGLEFRKADINRRLQLMVQQNLLDRGKVQTFLLALNDVRKAHAQHNSWRRDFEETSWLQRRVIAPLLNKLSKAGIDTKKLYVCDTEDLNYKSTNRDKVPPLVPATNASPRHLFATLPYLRNIIVISSRRDSLVERAHKHEVFKDAGKYNGFLVYNVGIKKGEAEAARKFFTDLGMKVVDLTVQQSWETTTPKPVAVTRTPAKKGLACLSSILSGSNINTHFSREERATRIDAPEFIIQLPIKQSVSSNTLPSWDRHSSIYIINLFGAKGGITTTKTMHENWIKKGAKEFNVYVIEKVCNYILFNPRIEEYWAFNPDRVEELVPRQTNLVELIYSNPLLKTEFDLVDNRTPEDKIYLSLWEHLSGRYRYAVPTGITKVTDWLNSIPLSAASNAVIVKLKDNSLIELLDTTKISRVLKDNTNPTQVKKTFDILITVLNG